MSGMTQEGEPNDNPDFPSIASDFEPLYQLQPAHYNAIVNGFFNLTTQTIHQLLVLDNSQAAQELADQAHDILLGYDDDLAELICRPARSTFR
jgi:hypothetical protein